MRWLLLLVLVCAACGKKPVVLQPEIVTVYETVEVKTPVPFKAQPPAELLASRPIPIPVFVAPSDPKASSALTPDGERLLRGLIEELLGQIAAWKAWATAP